MPSPWLGIESIVDHLDKDLIKPLEIAYRAYLRSIASAVFSTPIPLLHAGAQMPPLQDLIYTDTTRAVLSGIANQTMLTEDYEEWDENHRNWTPIGKAQQMDEKMRIHKPKTEINIQTRLKPRHAVPEKVYKTSFEISENIEKATKLLKDNQLLKQQENTVEIWTDSSYADKLIGGGVRDN